MKIFDREVNVNRAVWFFLFLSVWGFFIGWFVFDVATSWNESRAESKLRSIPRPGWGPTWKRVENSDGSIEWRWVGYTPQGGQQAFTFGIEKTIPAPQFPPEEVMGLVKRLLTMRAREMVSPERMIYQQVHEGSVLNLAGTCGGMVVLTSTVSVTLNRTDFARKMKGDNDGCSVWLVNGNLVPGRTITIPDSPELIPREGGEMALHPLLYNRVLFWWYNIADVWLEAYNELSWERS